MSEPYIVGIREVYDAVQEMKGQLHTFTSSTAVEIALLKQKVTDLETDRSAEKARRWQLNVALIGAFVAVGMGALGFILK